MTSATTTSTTMDYAKARETMVEQQVRPWEVLDARVLEVLNTVPREAYVPAAYRAVAYADMEIPLADGEVMLKPTIEGRMLQALALQPSDAVLEIGTGSGYLSACLGRLARAVLSLELHPGLAATARARLAEQQLDGNVRIETADALQYHAQQHFDAICVTGAVARIPPQFAQWLRPGGRMIVVHGRSPAMQAVLVHNDGDPRRVDSLFETQLPYLVGAAPVPEFMF